MRLADIIDPPASTFVTQPVQLVPKKPNTNLTEVSRSFDADHNEHVVLIEWRIPANQVV